MNGFILFRGDETNSGQDGKNYISMPTERY